MKLRAIGTGSPFCRHPLKPTSFLIYSENSLVCIGCPWSTPSLLEILETGLDKISMFLITNPQPHHTQGLIEAACFFRTQVTKPVLAAPHKLITYLRLHLEPELGFPLSEGFNIKAVNSVEIREEYGSHPITFVPNYMDPEIPSYGLRFENDGIFIAGDTPANEDWLFKEMKCEAILHACTLENKGPHYKAATLEELNTLPVYLQNKIWLYGYETYQPETAPYPMLFLPPKAWIYDSQRKERVLNKERLIREHSKKMLNN